MATLVGDSLRKAYYSSDDVNTKSLAAFLTLRIAMSGASDSSRVKRMMPDLREERFAPDLHSDGMMPDLKETPCGQCDETYFSLSRCNVEDIGDATFDLRLGGLVARSDTVLSGVREEDLKKMSYQVLESGEPFEFKCNPDGRNVYYFTSFEGLRHSSNLSVDVHAKSTTGRVGCHAKGVGRMGDGRFITLLQPLAFNLIAKSGETSFSQGVVRYSGSEYATRNEIVERGLVSFRGEKLEDFLHPLGVVIKFDTSRAYAAKRTNRVIDMSARDLDWGHWWEEMRGNSEMVLDAKRLYLLGSPVICLSDACGIISKETEVFNGLGGFGCLAGVVQSGFRGGITMEPYFPIKTRIRMGDVAGYVLIDPIMGKMPKSTYTGDYQEQRAPRLPKMFSDKKG